VETGSVVAFTSPIVASETLFIYLRAFIIQNKTIVPKGCCAISSAIVRC
jgi:hypothetical protein